MSIMTLPYTNLHEINLDWIIEEVKQAKIVSENVYSPENPPPYPVKSVNGETGDVTIIIPVTSVNGKTGPVVTPFINPGDAIQRIDTQSPNEEAGIQRVLNGSGIVTFRVTHNGDTPEAYVRYSIPNGQNQEYRLLTLSDIPDTSGVVSVNGMTGVVVVNGANLVISDTDNRTIAFAIDAAEDQLADQLDRILTNEDDITTIERGLAIMANGDTHAAVTEGQFVFVKSHPTLTPGVYVATANIATNEALTTNNLSVVPNGGFNALNNNLINKITSEQVLIPWSDISIDQWGDRGGLYRANVNTTTYFSRIPNVLQVVGWNGGRIAMAQLDGGGDRIQIIAGQAIEQTEIGGITIKGYFFN